MEDSRVALGGRAEGLVNTIDPEHHKRPPVHSFVVLMEDSRVALEGRAEGLVSTADPAQHNRAANL